MLTLGREMDRVSYEFSYENLIYDYKTIDDPNNYVEHTLSFTGYYKFFPKTKALIEYDFSKFNYENDSTRSADANQILTGLKGDLTAKLTGTVKVGYQDRKYKNNQDWKKPVTYLNLTYDVSEKTSLNVTAQRTVYESVYTVQNYFEEDSLQCLISQKLTAKTTASLSGLYARDMYPVTSSTDTTRRSDDIWDAKLAIDVKTRRWFNLGVSYEFSRRSSNLPINDYNDNIMSVYAKAMY